MRMEPSQSPACSAALGPEPSTSAVFISVLHAAIIQRRLEVALRSPRSCRMRCPFLHLLQLPGEGRRWAWGWCHFIHMADPSRHQCHTVLLVVTEAKDWIPASSLVALGELSQRGTSTTRFSNAKGKILHFLLKHSNHYVTILIPLHHFLSQGLQFLFNI